MEIDFDVGGSFRGNKVTITKQHRGRYRNAVAYNGTIVIDPDTNSYEMRGSYEHGLFELKFICADAVSILTAATANW